MDEQSGIDRKAQAAAFGRKVLAGLAWLGRLLLGLCWTAVYLLLRLVETSKRVWPTLSFLAAACFVVTCVLVVVRDVWLWSLLGLIIGTLWSVSSEASWEELKERLEFVVDSHPESRLLHADGELRRLLQVGRTTWHVWARLALVALFSALLITGWQEMTPQLHAMAVAFLAAASGAIFVAVTIAVTRLERHQDVRFFVTGWRLTDPEWLEISMLGKWPKLSSILAWRAVITSRLAPLRKAALPWLQPWGACAE